MSSSRPDAWPTWCGPGDIISIRSRAVHGVSPRIAAATTAHPPVRSGPRAGAGRVLIAAGPWRNAGSTRRNAVLERIEAAALETPDPRIHSAYARAIYPAWFADRDLAALFSPPRSTSVTGAAVAARIRREGYDWRPLLRGLPVPTIVIQGDADLLPVTLAEETAGTIGNARLLLLAGAGHMPFWEAPEHFFGAVDAFLSE